MWEAQSEGALRADMDASVVARLVFGMINSIVEWYRPGGREGLTVSPTMWSPSLSTGCARAVRPEPRPSDPDSGARCLRRRLLLRDQREHVV